MKCINCDKKIKSTDTYCSNCGINLKNIEVLNNNFKKRNNTIFYIVVFFLLLIGLLISTLLILNNNKDKNEKIIDIVIDSKDEVLIKNYLFTIPDGFSKKESYIENDSLIISYKEYPLSFNQITRNKEILINSLKEQGYTIEKYEIRKDDNKEYIVINTKMNKSDYCFVLYEIDNDSNIILTITSKLLSNFKEEWIDISIKFIKTYRKI